MLRRSYDAVVWDWNGTLLDDVELCVEIVNELLFENGISALEADRYKEIFDFPVRLYYERAGFDLERLDFSRLSVDFCTRFEERLDRAPLFPSAARVLDGFAQIGSRQFVLSSTEHEALGRMLRRYGIDGYFEAMQGMENTLAEGKITGGHALIERFGLDPKASLLIGDTLHDAEVAESLGMDCLLISSGHQSHARLRGLSFQFSSQFSCQVVDSLDHLMPSIGAGGMP